MLSRSNQQWKLGSNYSITNNFNAFGNLQVMVKISDNNNLKYICHTVTPVTLAYIFFQYSFFIKPVLEIVWKNKLYYLCSKNPATLFFMALCACASNI